MHIHTHTNMYFTRIRIKGVRLHIHIVLFVSAFNPRNQQESASILVQNKCRMIHVFPCHYTTIAILNPTSQLRARVLHYPARRDLGTAWDWRLTPLRLRGAWLKKNVENLQARAHVFSLGSWFEMFQTGVKGLKGSSGSILSRYKHL